MFLKKFILETAVKISPEKQLIPKKLFKKTLVTSWISIDEECIRYTPLWILSSESSQNF